MLNSQKETWQKDIDLFYRLIDKCDEPKVRVKMRTWIDAFQNHLNRGSVHDEQVLSDLIPRFKESFKELIEQYSES